MLFNSVLFLIFFSVVYVTYWSLSGNWRKYFLILASIVFYAVWGLTSEGWIGIRWTFHFLGMNVLNYLLIRAMFNRPDRKKALLAALITIDLGNLAFFKYFYFFLDMLGIVGLPIPAKLQELDIFLPLAISFYTFILIAYAVDVYRGIITERVGPVHFAVFVLFFPHLIAGPIMRHSDFMYQIDHPVMSKEKLYGGSWLLLSGLFKKAMLADPMGLIIAPVFREPQTYGALQILLAGMGFSLQVYADFSGYTDMARGAARLLGYEIPENFMAPFFAQSARELWQRWHITLATWLRDYIYIPLGGSRVSEFRVAVNYLVTFTIGGFWHGADYTYLAWGGLWGFLLAAERFFDKKIPFAIIPKNRIGKGVRILFIFFLFSIGAIMFRSQKVVHPGYTRTSGEIMVEMLSGLIHSSSDAVADGYRKSGGDPELVQSAFGDDLFAPRDLAPYNTIVAMFVALFLFHLFQYRKEWFERYRKYDPYLILFFGALFGGLILPVTAVGGHQFIYFVF